MHDICQARQETCDRQTMVTACGTTLLVTQNFSGTFSDWIYYIHCVYIVVNLDFAYFYTYTHITFIDTRLHWLHEARARAARRFLARISKMPVQNSNAKISVRPNIDTTTSNPYIGYIIYIVYTFCIHCVYIVVNLDFPYLYTYTHITFIDTRLHWLHFVQHAGSYPGFQKCLSKTAMLKFLPDQT